MAEEAPEETKSGAPVWVVTFADLMSLLLCFFVLLLSFSEIDAQRFRQIAGEMSKAFGVQREAPILERFASTSVLERVALNPPEPVSAHPLSEPQPQTQPDPSPEKVADTADKVNKILAEPIRAGRVQVQKGDDRVVIRIEEQASFPSGSAEINADFARLLQEMSTVFAAVPGTIAIEGHTDNVPIRTERFRSNWDLSAARAAAVANALLDNGAVEPGRLIVKGMADTRPRTDNLTPENRARNRRVEIIVDLRSSSAREREQESSLRTLLEQDLRGVTP